MSTPRALADERVARLEERVRALEVDRARLQAQLDAAHASPLAIVTARSPRP